MEAEAVDRGQLCFLCLNASKPLGQQDERIFVVGIHVLHDVVLLLSHPRHTAGQIVICQHPGALWVAHQLGHVLLAVISQHDSRLRAAANLRDVCDCLQRHVSASACLWWRSLVWTPFLAVQGAESTRIRVPSHSWWRWWLGCVVLAGSGEFFEAED